MRLLSRDQTPPPPLPSRKGGEGARGTSWQAGGGLGQPGTERSARHAEAFGGVRGPWVRALGLTPEAGMTKRGLSSRISRHEISGTERRLREIVTGADGGASGITLLGYNPR